MKMSKGNPVWKIMVLGALVFSLATYLLETLDVFQYSNLFSDILLGGGSMIVVGFILIKLNFLKMTLNGKAPVFTAVLLGAAISYAAGWALTGLYYVGFSLGYLFLFVPIAGAISALAVDFVFEKTGFLII